jgi:hypothetical protein
VVSKAAAARKPTAVPAAAVTKPAAAHSTATAHAAAATTAAAATARICGNIRKGRQGENSRQRRGEQTDTIDFKVQHDSLRVGPVSPPRGSRLATLLTYRPPNHWAFALSKMLEHHLFFVR